MSVFLIEAISLDGKLEEHVGQSTTDWTSKEDMAFFVEKTKEAGVVVMGRKTFETIGKPLKDRLNVVMSRSEGESSENLEYTNEDPGTLVKRLQKKFKDIAVIGGAEIFTQFLKAGVVTDLFVTVEPVIFGKGTPFVGALDRVDLELIETKKIGKSGVLLHYTVL